MAGQMCVGHPVPNPGESNVYIKNADPRNTRAYAEGRMAKMKLQPADTNPHYFGSAAHSAWQRGWNSVLSPDGPIKQKDCVAYPPRGSAP